MLAYLDLPSNGLRRKWLVAIGATAFASCMTPAHAQLMKAASSPGTATEPPMDGPSKLEWLDMYFGKKGFGPPLAVSRFLDRMYYLIRELSWTATGPSENLKVVTAPTGFVTDFASVPRPFWALLPPDDEYVTAAVIHDWLYWSQTTSRSVADLALKDCMVELGVSSIKVAAIYEAVSLFGGAAWDSNAALKAKGEGRVLKRFPSDLKVRWEAWKLEPDVLL